MQVFVDFQVLDGEQSEIGENVPDVRKGQKIHIFLHCFAHIIGVVIGQIAKSLVPDHRRDHSKAGGIAIIGGHVLSAIAVIDRNSV